MGHSVEWQGAYITASPEDGAQRNLVSQLALPISSNQTREQAQRVEALRAQITLMDPRSADRMYQRLTSPSDSLGHLFHLTLHHTTRGSLLSQLDAKRHGNDRGTDDRSVKPPPPPPPPRTPVPPPPVPHHDEPIPSPVPKPPQPVPHTTEPPWNPWPWKPPWEIDNQPTDPGSSKSSNWIKSSLSLAATALGTVVSVGLRAVSNPAMEKALEAAWIVFQITEAEPAALIGMAGEAAAEALIAEVLGVDPALVRNLNNIQTDFPVVDIISPRWIASVKTRGVLSTLPASALTEQLRSQYTSDLLNMIAGDKQALAKLDKAAEALLRNRGKLGGAWPSDLKSTSQDGVRKYLQEKTLLMVPSDHEQPLRRTLGKDLYRRLKDNKKALDQLGIKNAQQLGSYIDRQIDRIQSMGPSSEDFRVMAETAAKHLPEDVTEKWRQKHANILKVRKKRAGQ